MLIGLVPIGGRAFNAAISGTPFSIEMLMTIAAIGAVFIGATEEAATVVFLFLIGELLEGVAASRARASIQDLTKLVPETARLERDGSVDEVPAASLDVQAVIQVRPGDRIPADGVIVAGESAVDEAPVTGESTPVRKGVDGTVYAGTINGDGLLRVRVTAAAADNTIARVVRLVEEAQESKAPTERFIDRFSKYYTPGVVAVAALIAIVPPLLFGGDWQQWIYKGLAILLIGCPCALVISTPAAIAASLSAGARRGLLLKGGAVLEEIGRIQVACLDKTGTLTAGKPQVTAFLKPRCCGSRRRSRPVPATRWPSQSWPLLRIGTSRCRRLPMRAPSEARASGGRWRGVSSSSARHGPSKSMLRSPISRRS
jgi:Zn2+/Cd2+-exporting ATPase